MKLKTLDVTEAYKGILEQYLRAVVDDTNRVFDEDNDPIMIKHGDKKKHMVILHQNMKLTSDEILFNPFVGLAGGSVSLDWMYRNTVLSMRTYFDYVVKCIIADAQEGKELDVDVAVSQVSSNTLEEYEKIPTKRILFARLNNNSHKLQLDSWLDNDEELEKLGISKKARGFFKSCLNNLLNTTDIRQDYKELSPKEQTCVKLVCLMRVWKRFLDQMHEHIKKYCDVDFDTELLETILANMDEYQRAAGWGGDTPSESKKPKSGKRFKPSFNDEVSVRAKEEPCEPRHRRDEREYEDDRRPSRRERDYEDRYERDRDDRYDDDRGRGEPDEDVRDMVDDWLVSKHRREVRERRYQDESSFGRERYDDRGRRDRYDDRRSSRWDDRDDRRGSRRERDDRRRSYRDDRYDDRRSTRRRWR